MPAISEEKSARNLQTSDLTHPRSRNNLWGRPENGAAGVFLQVAMQRRVCGSERIKASGVAGDFPKYRQVHRISGPSSQAKVSFGSTN
jgi:hypothetical protein